MRLALLFALTIVAPAAARERPDAAAFDPVAFFAGATRSSGVMRDSGGEVSSRFEGATRGRREADGSTVFDQTIRFDDGTTRRRTWRIARSGLNAIEGTGTDVVGTARGEVRGRALHLVSTVRVDDGNPLGDLDFDQIINLRRDGRTLTNFSVVSKFGISFWRIEERFARAMPTGERR